MYEEKARALDDHFGHKDKEGPVTFILALLTCAQTHEKSLDKEIRFFFKSLEEIAQKVPSTHFTADPSKDHQAFNLCWAELDHRRHHLCGYATHEVREYTYSQLLKAPYYGLTHYDTRRDLGSLRENMREYPSKSLSYVALMRTVRFYEDVLIHLALRNDAIRGDLSRILRCELGTVGARGRAMHILACKEAGRRYNQWQPLREAMNGRALALVASP